MDIHVKCRTCQRTTFIPYEEISSYTCQHCADGPAPIVATETTETHYLSLLHLNTSVLEEGEWKQKFDGKYFCPVYCKLHDGSQTKPYFATAGIQSADLVTKRPYQVLLDRFHAKLGDIKLVDVVYFSGDSRAAAPEVLPANIQIRFTIVLTAACTAAQSLSYGISTRRQCNIRIMQIMLD